MYYILTPPLIWPSATVFKKVFLSKSFKLSYPNAVCIIDYTEVFFKSQNLQLNNLEHTVVINITIPPQF